MVLAEAEPYWQARMYSPPGWVIWPATPEETRRGRGTLGPDLVNATEHARRVVACAYARSMSRQRIWELYRTDPDFPTSWPTAGTERLWSWSHAERSYWQPRQPSPVNRRYLRVTERGPDGAGAPEDQPGARSTLVVAVAQPRVISPPHAADQVHRAVAAVHEAARRGAELLLFPEGYPGPLRVGEDHDRRCRSPQPPGRLGARFGGVGSRLTRTVSSTWWCTSSAVTAASSAATSAPTRRPATSTRSCRGPRSRRGRRLPTSSRLAEFASACWSARSCGCPRSPAC